MLIAVPSYTEWPPQWAATTATSSVIDAATDYVGVVFQAPVTGTIETLHFRTGTVSMPDTVTAGIYQLDTATGGIGAAISTATTATLGSSANFSVTISAAVTAGQYYVAAIKYSGASINASIVRTAAVRRIGSSGGFPYGISSTTGALVKDTSNNLVAFSIGYSGGLYHATDGVAFCGDSTTQTSNSSTNTAIGNYFVAPADMEIAGAWFNAAVPSGAAPIVELYSSGASGVGSPITSKTLQPFAGAQPGTAGGHHVLFDYPERIRRGSGYRIVVRNTNPSNSITWTYLRNSPSVSHMRQLTYTTIFWRTRYTTFWTDSTTELAPIGLLVSKVYDANGAGRASFNLGI